MCFESQCQTSFLSAHRWRRPHSNLRIVKMTFQPHSIIGKLLIWKWIGEYVNACSESVFCYFCVQSRSLLGVMNACICRNIIKYLKFNIKHTDWNVNKKKRFFGLRQWKMRNSVRASNYTHIQMDSEQWIFSHCLMFIQRTSQLFHVHEIILFD